MAARIDPTSNRREEYAIGPFTVITFASATDPPVRPWLFALVLLPGFVIVVALLVFMRSRSSIARPMPATADCARLGFAAGHGFRFVGGVSESSTGSTKRCSYPFGEMLIDDRQVVLRIRGIPGNRTTLRLDRREVVKITVGRGPLGIGVVGFETLTDTTGLIRYYGDHRVVTVLSALEWPTTRDQAAGSA